jgi:hypothetical protein
LAIMMACMARFHGNPTQNDVVSAGGLLGFFWGGEWSKSRLWK